MPVLLIIIDAGLLYSVTLLSALLCFVNHSNGQYVVLDMVRAYHCSLFVGVPTHFRTLGTRLCRSSRSYFTWSSFVSVLRKSPLHIKGTLQGLGMRSVRHRTGTTRCDHSRYTSRNSRRAKKTKSISAVTPRSQSTRKKYELLLDNGACR